MSVLKVIEVMAESDEGWEDAAQKAVKKASKTVKNVRSAYVHEMTTSVKNGEIDKYRVNVKITFALD
ncbi:MAG: dodecin family protein [Saprospiraceae bacterium]|nr:dodecin family protein [Saprospiraceae bacterium]